MIDTELNDLAALFESMPPVRAMALAPVEAGSRRLRLHAPLSANVNDKGCAFGGSLCSAMTLAAWGQVTLGLAREGLAAEVFVADSRVRYRAPLFADLECEGGLADGADWAAFIARLRESGQASVRTAARVFLPEGGEAAEMEARFVARLKSQDVPAGQVADDR